MRRGMSLFCRLAIPLPGLGIVLGHAIAIGVHDTKIVLRITSPCFAAFFYRIEIILRRMRRTRKQHQTYQ